MKYRNQVRPQVEQLESRDAPAVIWSIGVGNGKSSVTYQATDGGVFEKVTPGSVTVISSSDPGLVSAVKKAGYDAVPQFTTTTLSSSDSSSVYGDGVYFSATVSAGAGTPTGTVQFFVDGDAFGSPVGLVGGSATTATTSTFDAGSHTVTAVYTSSAATYFSSASASLAQSIAQREITVTADSQEKFFGDVDPDLTYQITDGNLVNGDVFAGAMSRVSGEDAGAYMIEQGSLSLSANYLLSFVGDFLTVHPASTTTSVLASQSTVNVGETVTFTATVSSSAGTPTGYVQFKVNGENLSAPVLLSGNTASISTSFPSAGNRTITATFVADNGNFESSASGEASVSVQSGTQQPTFTAISGVVGDTGTVGVSITFQIVNAPVGVGPLFTYVVFWGGIETDTMLLVPQVFEFEHTYSFPGTYSPFVQVSDLGGEPYDAFYDGILTIA